METHKYQESVCCLDAGLLHDYRILYQTKFGVVEQCQNQGCGKKQFFAWEIPNDVYLSYHIRSALQVNDPIFYKNYPNFQV